MGSLSHFNLNYPIEVNPFLLASSIKAGFAIDPEMIELMIQNERNKIIKATQAIQDLQLLANMIKSGYNPQLGNIRDLEEFRIASLKKEAEPDNIETTIESKASGQALENTKEVQEPAIKNSKKGNIITKKSPRASAAKKRAVEQELSVEEKIDLILELNTRNSCPKKALALRSPITKVQIRQTRDSNRTREDENNVSGLQPESTKKILRMGSSEFKYKRPEVKLGAKVEE